MVCYKKSMLLVLLSCFVISAQAASLDSSQNPKSNKDRLSTSQKAGLLPLLTVVKAMKKDAAEESETVLQDAAKLLQIENVLRNSDLIHRILTSQFPQATAAPQATEPESSQLVAQAVSSLFAMLRARKQKQAKQQQQEDGSPDPPEYAKHLHAIFGGNSLQLIQAKQKADRQKAQRQQQIDAVNALFDQHGRR